MSGLKGSGHDVDVGEKGEKEREGAHRRWPPEPKRPPARVRLVA